MLFLYNRNFDDSIVKINPLLRKLVNKLPRTWLFYKLYFVFVKIICATKKKVALTGEMLPIKDMYKYKKLVDDNFKRSTVTLYKCFKAVSIMISENEIDLNKEEKLYNIKKAMTEVNNKIDDSDIILYEFTFKDFFNLLRGGYDTNEELKPNQILSVLYPIIKDELNTKENLIFSIIFVKEKENFTN